MRFLFNSSVLCIVFMIFISCGDKKKKGGTSVNDECELLQRTLENFQKLSKIAYYNDNEDELISKQDLSESDLLFDELESIWSYAFDNFSDDRLRNLGIIINNEYEANYCMNEADMGYLHDLQDIIEDYYPLRDRMWSLRNMIALGFEGHERDHYGDYDEYDYDKEGYYDKKEDKKEEYYENERHYKE